ncbi:unnamed protein product [Lactuca saligna]|uniref:Uncharacterized protein n=1 Tax=Lactuca saligna TaxID=75948 RepID=A0AA36DY12_LACSI|nr:unnamed protein product [Lactuca saligna]
MNSPHQQTPIRNNGLHLVYVRRKPESEHHKNTICNNKSKHLPITLSEQDDNNQQQEQSPMKDSPINIPETSSALPSVTDITSNSHQLDYTKKLSVQNWEERYLLLQNFLKAVDQSTQDDYLQMLRSLSSVDLSRLAVELERRTIRLSMEEAKEVRRAKIFDAQWISDSNK